MSDRYYEIGTTQDSLGITHSIYLKITRNQRIEVIYRKRTDVNNLNSPIHETNLTKLSENRGLRSITKEEYNGVKKQLEHKVCSGARAS